MRKIKLLLLAVFALVGMGAFAAVFPEAGAQGYLYNEASGLFMTGKAEVTLVAKADVTNADIYNVWYKNASENNGKNIRFSTSAASPWTSLRYNEQKLVVGDDGYCKWGLSIAADGSFTLFYPSNYSSYGPTGYLTVDPKTKTFTSTAEPTPYSNWKFLTQKQFEAIVVSIEVEPEPEAPKVFPETGAVGYLYNAASGKFIDANGAIAVTGAQFAVYRKSSDNNDTDIRFGVPGNEANKHLRINGDNPVLQANDPYYSKWGYEVKDDGKFLLKAGYDYDYGCKKGNYLTVKEDGTFEYVETANDASYWQFVDQETYEKILEILASEPLIRPLLNASPLATDGTTKQYLYNLKAKGFLVGANDWGTRASISTDEGILFSVQDNGDGTYALVSPKGTVGVDGGNSWIDSNGRFQEGYTINFNDDGTFTIGNTAVGGYLSLDPSKADDTRLYFTAEATKWIAVSEADYPVCKPEVAAYAAAYKGVVDAYKKSISSNKLVKYTSVAELNGVSFSIINEADGKAVYGTKDQNLAYDIFDKAFANTNSGYKYTLEAIDGGYLVRLMTPSGSPYSVWGNPGYVNSGAPGGFNGCFVLGLKNQNGQDVANGAVWEIEYVEGKGFTMKNKALGGYFAGNSPAPSGTDPIYWTFGELVVDNGNPLYKDYLAALNAVEAIYPNSLTESKQAKVQALLSKYAVNKVLNSIATESSINAAIEALNVVGLEIQLTNLIAEAKDCLKEEMSSAAKENLTAVIDEYDGVEFESLKEITDATNAVQDAIAAAKASAATIADYRNAIAAARAILPETMPAGVLVALDKAINDYPENKVLTADATDETVGAAATALWNAYNAAKTTVDSSKALMAMYELMENNNVVTAEAYETYMGKFETYSSQWEAGTLAEAVVNPYALNGWHNNSLDYDDYLLSAWSVGDNKCNNYDTELYINTWSVEGENDGTNFKVPFFEYWTGDDNSLGAKELVANLKDLEPGVYEVTAWVRARAKNGTDAAEATGITFQVNDGDAVDVTEGETVGQFNIAEYVVEAVVEDGNLTVKFSVAGDNNISWLSFQNVKYTKTGDIISTAISEVGEKAAAKTVYNVAGQQLTAPVKGLNIVDGKKIYVK